MQAGPGVDAGGSSAHPAEAGGGARRTWRSLRALLLQPGLLTRKYARGRGAIYLHPLLLFLIANLFFFLVTSLPGASRLTPPLRAQLYQQAYSGSARAAVRERFLEMDSVAFQRFETRFDSASETQAKALVIVLVPLFTLLLWLSRCWRRGERMVGHAVFATHYLAALMLIVAGLGLLVQVLRLLSPPGRLQTGIVLAWSLVLPAVAYLYAALRNAYGDATVPALVRAAALGAGMVALLVLYRFILFFTVLYTI